MAVPVMMAVPVAVPMAMAMAVPMAVTSVPVASMAMAPVAMPATMAVSGAGRGSKSGGGESEGRSNSDFLHHGLSPCSKRKSCESPGQKRRVIFRVASSPPSLICVQYTRLRTDAYRFVFTN
jgi:hypothetical protein